MLAHVSAISLQCLQDPLSLDRFDGDGMLHACRIKDGKVSYCNRYVSTARLERERSLGFPIYMRVNPGALVRGICSCRACLRVPGPRPAISLSRLLAGSLVSKDYTKMVPFVPFNAMRRLFNG